jgi:hypothetical protein
MTRGPHSPGGTDPSDVDDWDPADADGRKP